MGGEIAVGYSVVFEEGERALLRELPVARLATIAPGGEPHIVPVCFALIVDEIVIAVDEKPKRSGTLARVRNIERDPRVTLLADRYSDDWTGLAWVRVEGTATVRTRGAEYPEALAALRARYPQYLAMALEELPLIVVAPDRVVSWRWTSA